MRSIKKILVLSAVIMTLSVIGVNAQNSSGRTMEQQIARKLAYLPYYGVFDYITFKVDGSTVTLNGKVDSIRTKSEAKGVVKDIPGVTDVVNNIEQLPASPYDDAIRKQALRAFQTRGPSQYVAGPHPDVRIIVENGRITLEGYVNNSSHSGWLNMLANGIPGVFNVQNNLIVGKSMLR